MWVDVAMLDTTMEVDHSSSDDWSSSEMKIGVGSATSKKVVLHLYMIYL